MGEPKARILGLVAPRIPPTFPPLEDTRLRNDVLSQAPFVWSRRSLWKRVVATRKDHRRRPCHESHRLDRGFGVRIPSGVFEPPVSATPCVPRPGRGRLHFKPGLTRLLARPVFVGVLVFLFGLLHATPADANPGLLRLDTPRFSLAFAADGRPASLKTKLDGREWLNLADPGPGFYLETRGGAQIRLERLCLVNDRVMAAGPDGLPRITFVVRPSETHIALRLERMEAVPASREVSLHFPFNIVEPVGLLELDYMTEALVAHPFTFAAQMDSPDSTTVKSQDTHAAGQARVDWHHVWNRHPGNPPGGFALYCPHDPADEDDTILRIWTVENLPHPRVAGPWTLEAARDYVARWTRQHADPSRFWIQASTPEELYEAVPYAEAARVRDVYLFTDTWRGEPFWAQKVENWHVNRKVFPKGEPDLRSFSDYLRQRGMNLKIHWVSGGIGPEDPVYVGKAPDPRLATWGGGQLTRAASPDDGVLFFRPDSGVSMPFRMPGNEWWKQYTCPPMLHAIYDYEMVQVGNELVRVGSFADTDREVWRLENCQRGLFLTDPEEHAAGARLRGLITAYGQNALPDNDSTLLEEMARNFAEFLNRCRIPHNEYDGAELHAYNGRMWGYRKFSSLVYQNMDQPVTAFSSSGVAPPCYLEHRLNATRRLLQGRLKGIVPIMLDEPARPASTVLDAHWGLSQMCAHGFNFYNIQKPEPLFGINVNTLKQHGLTDAILEAARNWKRVNALIQPAQRRQIHQTMYSEDSPLAQAGHHLKSRVVHELVRGDGGWKIHPTAVLIRPGKLDVAWQDGQEHGAISPRQFLKPGTAVTLVNPFSAQRPRVILRVLWGFEPKTAATAAAAAAGSDRRGADANFDYARLAQTNRSATGTANNVWLQPRAEEIRNRRDIRIENAGDALTLSAVNPLDRPVYEENALPEWSRGLDMSRHRGLGLWVTGDAGEAILVIQIAGGDYVIPIDFTGRRYIEIPHAQAAWAEGRWGWRMGAKHAHYEGVNWVKMGFGKLPAKSTARITVEGLTALREVDTHLKDAVLHFGSGSLAIHGAVPSGSYLTWDGGHTAVLHDANWNETGERTVTGVSQEVPAGEFEFRLTSSETDTPPPWIELQILTRGPPILVADDDKPPAAR